MVRAAHDDDGAKLTLAAPSREDATFVLRAGDWERNAFDILDTQRPQEPGLARELVFMRDAPPRQLQVHIVRLVGKDSDPAGYSTVHEVGCLQDPRSAGIHGDDDRVGRTNLVGRYQRPAGSPQDSPPTDQQGGQDDSHNPDRRAHSKRSRWPAHAKMIHVGFRGPRRQGIAKSVSGRTLVIDYEDFSRAKGCTWLPEARESARRTDFCSGVSGQPHGQFLAN
jgi:hypothetical protein